MKFTCCECGKTADLDIDLDGTGRNACSKKCADLLLGKHLPPEKRQGWYCKQHGKKG